MNHRITKESIEAARSLIAEGNRDSAVEQVHSVTLHTVDYNAEPDQKVLTIIPIGGVMGFVTHRQDEVYKDEDIFFVSAAAFGKAIVACGYSGAVSTTQWLIPPENQNAETVQGLARRMVARFPDDVLRELVAELQARAKPEVKVG